MNAAARALSQGGIFRGDYANLSVSKPLFGLTLTIALVLMSALAVVYIKNTERQYFSELQQIKQQTVNVQLEWGKLMLEQSTWSAPSRVQRKARRSLAMHHPKPQLIVL